MDHTGANPKPTVVAIIPARFASVRLPGKALLDIAGKPMIWWVVERAMAARSVSRVIVATDDDRILNTVRAGGYEAVKTRNDHSSGTDRIAEVAAQLEGADIIVNLQGDEPMISPSTIDLAVEALIEDGGPEDLEPREAIRAEGAPDQVLANTPMGNAGIATTWEPIESARDVLSQDVVKLALDQSGRALYFSRAPIPFPHDAVRKHGSLQAALSHEPSLSELFRKHTGLYVFWRKVLLQFTSWPPSILERLERLEQLRALEHGVKIKAVRASTLSIGVDTAADLDQVRALIEDGKFEVSGFEFQM